MNVDFEKLNVMRTPNLVLRHPHGTPFGQIVCPLNVSVEVNWGSISKLEFEAPQHDNSEELPYYHDIKTDAVVDFRDVGQFVIVDVKETDNGAVARKKVTCKSLEYELDTKQLVIKAGTYRLWDPVKPSSSILGMALEKFPDWHIEDITSTSLLTRYRTISDTTDSHPYTFLMDTVQELYGCIFDFDTYTRTIRVIDRDDTPESLPIFISLENLIKERSISDDLDNYCTAADVSGADGVTIREVNPAGENCIYNLDYPISIGRIPEEIGEKWKSWQNAIKAKQEYFKSLVAMRNAASARYISDKTTLAHLKEERTSIENRRSTTIQALAVATTATEKEYFDNRLNEINAEIKSKDSEIASQQEIVDTSLASYKSLNDQVEDATLRKEDYFSKEELALLGHYIYETKIQDPSFAVFDVDVSGEGDSYMSIQSGSVKLEGVTLLDVDMEPSTGRRIFDVSGGSISFEGIRTELKVDGSTETKPYAVTGQLHNAVFDHKDGTDLVMSAFVGHGTCNGEVFASGTVSLACKCDFNDNDWLTKFQKVETPDLDEDGNVVRNNISYKGDNTIDHIAGNMFFTKNATDYQRYSVEQSLYDYAQKKLEEMAWPIYEFDVDTANFLFIDEFKPYKDALKLGCGIYLRLERFDAKNQQIITPRLLGAKWSFDESSSIGLTFSNRFQRINGRTKFNQDVTKTRNAARSMQAQQFKNGAYEDSGAKNIVKEFLEEGRLAAKLTVTSPGGGRTTLGDDGMVSKDGSGRYQLVINNGMFALIDNETGTARFGAGHFYNETTGTDWCGINAEIIGGNLIFGENLYLHTKNLTGDMQEFSIDQRGVILRNGRLFFDHDRGGQVLIDPTVGIAVGTDQLYTFKEDGSYQFNEKNASFYINTKGKLCLRDIDASGTIHGSTITGSEIYIGGDETASDCKFGVDKLGNILGLETANGALRFDSMGEAWFNNSVHISGGLELTGPITWSSSSFPIQSLFAATNSTKESDWHPQMTAADKWRKDKGYNGQYGTPYQFRGTDGANGRPGSDADVTRANIVRAMLDAIDQDGLYTTTIDGKQCLGINATAIKTGTLDAIEIRGCTITANSTINVKTNAHIGSDLYLGYDGKTWYGNMKKIHLSQGAVISCDNTDSPTLSLSSGTVKITGGTFDLSEAFDVVWGKNAPNAVFK